MISIGARAVKQTLTGTIPSIKYGNFHHFPPPLTKAEECKLAVRMLRGDIVARNILVEHNLRLLVFISRKYENTGISPEDLISIGTIGLIKAVNSFAVERNIRLATYASRCIENEILMYMRRYANVRTEISFDALLDTDQDGNQYLLSDTIGTEADVTSRNLDAIATRHSLYRAIRRLNARDQSIVDLRYGLRSGVPRTQQEVAHLMGISQSYISRLERRIMKRLHAEMVEFI